MGEPRSGARRALRIARILLFPAIVVGVFIGILPRIANLDHVWRVLRGLSPGEDLILVLLAVWNLVTYWPMLVGAMPGLTLAQAAVVCQSSTSVAMTVPGGGAIAVGVSYAMYTSWGFRKSQVALSAFLTFVANMSFKLVLPVVALGLLALEGEHEQGLVPAAIVGVAVLFGAIAMMLLAFRSERIARYAGLKVGQVASFFRHLFGRAPVAEWGEAAVRFRSQLIGLVRQRWLMVTVFEVVSQLSVFAVMLAAARFAGISNGEVTLVEALAVFAFVRLGTAMPIIPGNVGIAELGYIGGLVVAGAPKAEAVAAVFVFRFLTYFVQIPIGGLTYVVWRRNHAWRVQRAAPVGPQQGHAAGDAVEVEDGPGGDGHEREVRAGPAGADEQADVSLPEEHAERPI